jgi:cell division septation protein DedD
MKASPNREQQLFLITGGVILLLILAVVIFNMVRSPTELVEDEVTKRPMVRLTDKLGRTNHYPEGAPNGTAAVFGNHADNKELNFEKIKPRAIVKPGEKPADPPAEDNPEHVLGGQTPDERLEGGWNRSPADLEASRREVELALEAKKKKAAAAAKKKKAAAVAAAKRKKAAAEAEKKAKIALKKAPVEPVTKRTEPVADFSKAIANVVTKQKQAQQAQAQPVKPAVVVASKPPARSKAKPAYSTAKPSGNVTSKNGYSVQIASLSSTQRAQVLEDRLRAFIFDGKRMPVYQGTATVGAKTYYRVRLGPFSSRTKAERAGRLIQSKIGMDGRLIKPSSK